jgi:putative MATE family efflux protein
MLVQAAMVAVDAFYVGWLGSDALAGIALVLPVMMLMSAMATAAIDGGISSAIARALGRGLPGEANVIATHAVVLSVAFAVVFTVVHLAGARTLYAEMGAHDGSLDAALTYSNIVFGGAAALWLLNCLASILRGSGQMMVPSVVMILGEFAHVALAPLLIFGWGPIPAFGIAGAGASLVATLLARAVVLAAFIASGRSLVTPLPRARMNVSAFREILSVGLPAALNTVLANGFVVLLTGLVGPFGTAALAGYGLGARLEYFMIPIVFGFGGALVPIVGMNVGTGQAERARRMAGIGAALASAVAGAIGLVGAVMPRLWLSLFTTDADVLAVGTAYLRLVGPTYVLFGLGLSLYFASQGAGRLRWPLIASAVRIVMASAGGWIAAHWLGADAPGIFVASAVAISLYGAIIVLAVWLENWGDTPHHVRSMPRPA